jgi:hypothetical protein
VDKPGAEKMDWKFAGFFADKARIQFSNFDYF